MTKPIKPERELNLVSATANTTEPMLQVAFATNDRLHVNQHFGSARTFLVYAKHAEDWQVVKAIEYPEQPQQHDADKLAHRVAALAQCARVYCNEIGPSAIHRLLKENTQPFKVDMATPIKQLLGQLQHDDMLKPNKAEPTQTDRLKDLLEEDWF